VSVSNYGPVAISDIFTEAFEFAIRDLIFHYFRHKIN
jgi:hypothetical protein